MNNKRMIAISLAVVFALTLAACSPNDTIDYPKYSVVDNNELGCVELVYEGITYRPFGVFGHNKLRGAQIGVRDDSSDSKICEIKGYSSSEWIVDYLDGLMGGNMIYKAVGVTEIPTELEPYREYNY